MKKIILIVLLFSLSLIQFETTDAYMGVPFDVDLLSPRFQYWTDDNDVLITLRLYFWEDDDTDDTVYTIKMEQIDLNGNVVDLITTFYIDPEDPLSTGEYWDTIIYDWSTANIYTTEPLFYRLMYNNINIYTGGIMVRPNYLDYGGDSIEFGTYVYNNSGLVDAEDQFQFTNNINDNLMILLHYRFSTSVIGFGNEYYIKFMDLGTMTDEFTLQSDSILTVQDGGVDTDTEHLNSFIPLFIGDEFPSFLETDFWNLNEDLETYFFNDFDIGSYLLYVNDDVGVFIPDSESSAILNITETDKVFSLSLNYTNIVINESQKATFYKDNLIADSVYTTMIAYDAGILTDWSDLVDDIPTVYAINYSLLQTLETGDHVAVVWQLEPTILPYSLDTTDYLIAENITYYVTDSVTIDTSLTKTFDWFGWNDDKGLLFVSVAIIIIANIIMVALGVQLIPILIVNGAIIGMLSFLGFLPLWLIIGISGIMALGAMLKLSKGDD